MRKKRQYSELFWSVFSRIRTEYGEILISPYSVRIRENTDQNNSEYDHFLRSAPFCVNISSCKGILKYIDILKKLIFHKKKLVSKHLKPTDICGYFPYCTTYVTDIRKGWEQKAHPSISISRFSYSCLLH